MIDDSCADLKEEVVEAEFCEKACEISPQRRTWRPDLCGDAETRPDEGEEPDVCPGLRGDVAENPDGPVTSAEPGEDVEVRPAAVEEPNAGRDLRGDVTAAPVTVIEPRGDVAKTHVDDLAAIDSISLLMRPILWSM